VTGPPGNYDNYRNSWGAIRPTKRQKRTRACFATRCGVACQFSSTSIIPFFASAVKINVITLITGNDDAATRKIACSVIFPIARKSKDHFLSNHYKTHHLFVPERLAFYILWDIAADANVCYARYVSNLMIFYNLTDFLTILDSIFNYITRTITYSRSGLELRAKMT